MADQELISKAEDLISSARHSSVSVSRLTNGENKLLGGSVISNKPIISYLFDDEQPHYIYKLQSMKNVTIHIKNTGEKNQLSSPTLNPTGWFAVTDHRFLIIVNGETEDDVISIPLNKINKTKYDNKRFRGTTIWIDTDNYKYKINYPKSAPEQAITYIRNYNKTPEKDLEEQHYITNKQTVIVCKKCREEVPDDAKKCPHCGYYPGSGGKGSLWHGTALATSWTPIGMAMLAKGAADEARTRRGVAEEIGVTDANANDDDNDDDAQTGSEDSFEKLERLNELKEQGILSEEEFQKKKEEILDDI